MLVSKLSITETISSLKQNNIDLIEYINKICDRINEYEPKIQALIPENNRRKRLINDAENLKKRFPDKENLPPLYAILVGVKDIFHAKGFPTKAGSKLPEDLFQGNEASCVTKLKEAGALILGKTVTTEFAFFEPGPTKNPYNLNHTPGGSSSGSAAGVSAGFCHIAFGTQTIGSIIRPASYCGIVGYKPSYNRISTDGVIPFSESADHVGFFTYNINGTKIVASILCDNWNNNLQQDKTKLPVIGIPDGKYLMQATNTTLKYFEEQLIILEKAGYIIKRMEMFDDIEEINRKHKEMISAEISKVHKEWFKNYSDLYRHHTKEIIMRGQSVSLESLNDDKKTRFELRERIENIMRDKNIDIWLSPSAVDDAPKGIASTGNPIMSLPWTFAGLPTISLPTGLSKNNLPMGLQFTSSFMNDEALIEYLIPMEEIFVE